MSVDAQVTENVVKKLELEASPERVWAALASPGRLAQWFPDEVEIESMTPGARGWFVWRDHGRYAFTVEDLVEGVRMVWRWARNPNVELEETHSTVVSWKLAPRPGGGTLLELVESGFADDESRRDNDGGWDQELGELVALLAT